MASGFQPKQIPLFDRSVLDMYQNKESTTSLGPNIGLVTLLQVATAWDFAYRHPIINE